MNEKGREKKYEGKEWDMTSFYIPISFKKCWSIINRLAEIDSDPEFKQYCTKIEGVNITNRKQGKKGQYIRWILYDHSIRKIHLLGKDK